MEKKTYIIEVTESEAAALEALGIQPFATCDEHKVEESLESEMVSPTMTDNAQDQPIEPENIDKVSLPQYHDPFVKAQISTKNQMILRNILAALSSLGVVIVFILEKLGIM